MLPLKLAWSSIWSVVLVRAEVGSQGKEEFYKRCKCCKSTRALWRTAPLQRPEPFNKKRQLREETELIKIISHNVCVKEKQIIVDLHLLMLLKFLTVLEVGCELPAVLLSERLRKTQSFSRHLPDVLSTDS
jgi:hypothetical protein